MAIPPGYMLVPAPGAMQVDSHASCEQLVHLQQHVEYLSSHAALGLVTSCCGSGSSSWAAPASRPRGCAALQVAWAAPYLTNSSSLCFTLGSVCMWRLEGRKAEPGCFCYSSWPPLNAYGPISARFWNQQSGLPLSLAASTRQNVQTKILAILSYQ